MQGPFTDQFPLNMSKTSLTRSFNKIGLVLSYLADLALFLAVLVILPPFIARLFGFPTINLPAILPFLLSSVISFAFGIGCKLLPTEKGRRPLKTTGALIVVSLGWILVSLLGALPFVFELQASFLDSFFEAMSGFTTTGITMFTGLDHMPASILLWRSMTQWVGGLGILTLFLFLVFSGGAAHRLFSAESHKVFSKRPAPGMFNTLKILWSIYALFTLVTAIALWLQGLDPFEALNHAFTTLSTGGFSTHDASIAHFERVGFPHYRWIEYTIIFSMTLGGISFFNHYRLLRGEIRALWDGLEIRLWWKIICGSLFLVMLDHFLNAGGERLLEVFRNSLFQVVAVLTTTGFATEDIAGPFFPAMAKQVFLVLMVIGGCVGSTGGGVKVLRIGVLWEMVRRQIRKTVYPRGAVNPIIVDGEKIESDELRRIASFFFLWSLLLVAGGAITALFSDLSPLASLSGIFSALGNIGPTYIPLEQLQALGPAIKMTYVFAMLAGRLEILPLLLLLNRRAWR